VYSTVDKLRFIKVDNNQNTQKVYKEYYRDIIQNYGSDLIYFRKDSRYYEESSLANVTYGEDTTATHWTSAPMIGLMTVNNDAYTLNKFGIEASTNGEVYIGIEEFEENFIDVVGTPTSGSHIINYSKKIYGGQLADVGTFASNIVCFNYPVAVQVPDGLTDYTTTIATSAVSGTSKTINDLLAFKHRYPYTRAVSGEVIGDLRCVVDEYGDGTCSGVLTANVWYNDYLDSNGCSQNAWKIAPMPGDFFRMAEFQLYEDGKPHNFEEYEVTTIYDRNITSGGLNPLLGTYVWKIGIVRRDASNEVVASPTIEELQTTDKSEQNIWHENMSDTIFEYENNEVDDIDKKQADSVYGLY
jgi:hypothetical protein